jgi:hypothetical protein
MVKKKKNNNMQDIHTHTHTYTHMSEEKNEFSRVSTKECKRDEELVGQKRTHSNTHPPHRDDEKVRPR